MTSSKRVGSITRVQPPTMLPPLYLSRLSLRNSRNLDASTGVDPGGSGGSSSAAVPPAAAARRDPLSVLKDDFKKRKWFKHLLPPHVEDLPADKRLKTRGDMPHHRNKKTFEKSSMHLARFKSRADEIERLSQNEDFLKESEDQIAIFLIEKLYSNRALFPLILFNKVQPATMQNVSRQPAVLQIKAYTNKADRAADNAPERPEDLKQNAAKWIWTLRDYKNASSLSAQGLPFSDIEYVLTYQKGLEAFNEVKVKYKAAIDTILKKMDVRNKAGSLLYDAYTRFLNLIPRNDALAVGVNEGIDYFAQYYFSVTNELYETFDEYKAWVATLSLAPAPAAAPAPAPAAAAGNSSGAGPSTLNNNGDEDSDATEIDDPVDAPDAAAGNSSGGGPSTSNNNDDEDSDATELDDPAGGVTEAVADSDTESDNADANAGANAVPVPLPTPLQPAPASQPPSDPQSSNRAAAPLFGPQSAGVMDLLETFELKRKRLGK